MLQVTTAIAFQKRNICSLLDIIEIYQFVGNGVDGEAGCGVDLKFGGYVAAVGGYSVHGEEECIGDLLVAHTFGNAADDVLLSFAQGLRFVFSFLRIPFWNAGSGSALLKLLFNPLYCRHEQIVLNETM